jgi:hypothetical protein
MEQIVQEQYSKEKRKTGRYRTKDDIRLYRTGSVMQGYDKERKEQHT